MAIDVRRQTYEHDYLDDYEAGELGVELDDKEPQEVLEWAIDRFRRERFAVCTSFQSDGMAILDMAWRIDPKVRVFTVDTGRMPAETYDLMEKVRDKYGMQIEVYYPEPLHLQPCFAALGGRPGDLPNAEAATRESLAIPVHPELDAPQLDHVIATMREFFK